MSLVREDMLRELELLPVWRLRAPAEVNTVSDTVALAPVTPISEPPSEKVADVLPEIVIATPVIAEPVITEAFISEPGIPYAEEVASPPLAATEVQPQEVISPPLIESPWLVLCPQAGDAAAQQLLKNIVQALKLPPEALHVSDQDLKVTQVQGRFCILFGLQAANTFLGTNHAEITSIRGQLLKHADLSYVVTHHPHAMLEDPLLKKQVWHDVCLLLATQ
jgi:uracil-DNA glycosylase